MGVVGGSGWCLLTNVGTIYIASGILIAIGPAPGPAHGLKRDLRTQPTHVRRGGFLRARRGAYACTRIGRGGLGIALLPGPRGRASAARVFLVRFTLHRTGQRGTSAACLDSVLLSSQASSPSLKAR